MSEKNWRASFLNRIHALPGVIEAGFAEENGRPSFSVTCVRKLGEPYGDIVLMIEEMLSERKASHGEIYDTLFHILRAKEKSE